MNIWLYQLNTYLLLVNYFTSFHDNRESPGIEYTVESFYRQLSIDRACIMMEAKLNMHWLEILLETCQKLLETLAMECFVSSVFCKLVKDGNSFSNIIRYEGYII